MAKVRNSYRCPFKLVLSSFSNTNLKHFSTAKDVGPGAFIPKRIERGPTDILKALSRTVQRDPTAPHYKFPDDPFFETKYSFMKKSKALALESGRKSARWIVENNPEYFKERTSEPFIKMFTPKLVYNENSDVVEETLISIIEEKNVSDAIIVYDLLKSKGIELSADTKQMLLELVCFYNCEDKGDEKDLESKWYKGIPKDLHVKTWKDGGFAEKLFESINLDCPLAYSALIQGMLKYGQIDKAVQLIDEARSKNLSLSVDVYNEILGNVQNIRENDRWTYMINLLKEMESKKIKPNLGTMNSLLHSLIFIGNLKNKVTLAMSVLAEFQSLKIKPSLGTYSFLVHLLCKGWHSPGTYRDRKMFVKKMLLELSLEEDLEIRHPSDINFFPTTMEICGTILKDPELAHILHGILLKNDNIKFLVSNITEIIYYRDYLGLLFVTEPIECAMKMYNTLVPFTYAPDSSLIQKILSAIRENNAFEFLPTIWSGLKFNAFGVQNVAALDIINIWPDCKEENEEVSKVFLEAANIIYEKIYHEENALYNIEKLDNVISNMIIIFLKFEIFVKAKELWVKVKTSSGFISLSHDGLTAFFNFCLSKQMNPEILDCLKLAKSTKHPELREMAKNALPHLQGLSESDLKWINEKGEE